MNDDVDARIAAIEAAPDAPESLRASVAAAMEEHYAFTEDRESDGYWLTCRCGEWDDPIRTAGGKLSGSAARWRLHRADAAIAVCCAPATDAAS